MEGVWCGVWVLPFLFFFFFFFFSSPLALLGFCSVRSRFDCCDDWAWLVRAMFLDILCADTQRSMTTDIHAATTTLGTADFAHCSALTFLAFVFSYSASVFGPLPFTCSDTPSPLSHCFSLSDSGIWLDGSIQRTAPHVFCLDEATHPASMSDSLV